MVQKDRTENKGEIFLLFGLKIRGLLCSNFNDRNLIFRRTDSNGYFTDRYEKGRRWGGGTSLYGLHGDVPLDWVWFLNSLS